MEPSTSSPYAAGKLSSDTVLSAINALNTMRYIAGLNSSVANNATYEAYAQAGALVMASGGGFSHYPSCPDGMDESLYNQGYTGCSSSNIAYGLSNPAKAIIGFCDDLGDNNKGVAGHRRWLLSPRLGKVGIGQVGVYNATYVSDYSDSSTTTDVAWPARLMPTSFFDAEAQWSFTTSTNLGSSVSAQVVRQRDGKTWDISSSELAIGPDGIGYVSDTSYIWDLDGVGSYRDGDVFEVTLTGSAGSKSYTVEFFDLYPVDTVEILKGYEGSGGTLSDGETVRVSEGSSAQVYEFIPSFTEDAYPEGEAAQSIADAAREGITITYTSSDESVATVEPRGTHSQVFNFSSGMVPADWVIRVTPIALGTTTITATLSNGLTSSIVFTVSKKSINPDEDSRGSIYAYNTSMTYTGSALHPTFRIYYGSSSLTEGTDYQISYQNEVNAGTATATITGIGDYEGSYDVTYTINPASLSYATVSSIANQTYTGSGITPTPAVTLSGTALKKGTDYTLSYADNTNVGTATVTITGKGNYTGTLTKTFKIVAAPMSSATVARIASQTYTGEEVTPAPTVKLGSKTLTEGTDYTPKYANNTNVGTATITLTGKGNMTGSTSVTFKIVQADIASTMAVIESSLSYTGSALTPKPTLSYGSVNLTEGTDYTLSYANNTNAGTATVTATGKGNFTGTRKVTFKITRADIAWASVASIVDQTYTGSAITPTPAVKFGSTTLTKGTDYTLSYSNNVDAGTATVIITGKGNYSGSVAKTFTIAPAPISSATVGAIASQAYTGAALKPAPTVTFNGTTLVAGTDYTLAYGSNTNAGTATVTITGTGNFTGTTKATFKITQASISAATVVTITKQTYTGSAFTPAPAVKLGTKTLTEGTDYTLSYKNNTNKGTATVIATGKGNYTGTVSQTFTIVAAPLSSASVAVIANQAFTGSALEPKPVVTFNGTTLTEGTDYTLTYTNNTNVGSATVNLKGKGNFTGTVAKSFKIVAGDLSNATVTVASQTYTGAALTPAPTVKLGSKTLTKDTDYTVDYANNTNAGTATVTVTGAGNYAGETTTTFKIAAAPLSSATIKAPAKQTYTGAALKPAPTVTFNGATLVASTDYTLAYGSNVNAGTAKVTLTGKGNFTGSATTSFTIAPASIAKATVTAAAQPYTGSALTPAPTVKLGSKTLAKGTDYTLAYANNTKVGTATVTVTGAGNCTGTAKGTFAITKAQVAVPTAKAGLTYTGSAQVGVAAGTGYKLSGTAKATKAGSYTATATLTDTANYEWADGSSEAKTVTWSIAKAKITSASASIITTVTYTGEKLTPKPTLKLGSYTLKEGTDYTLSYTDNLDAGTATVSVKGKGSVTGTISLTFTIVWPNPFADVTVGETSHDQDILWLAAKGISAGWDEADGIKTFRPNDDVKRGDMAAFLFRLAKLWGAVKDGWEPTDGDAFLDVDERTSHRDEILWLAEQGISTGWEVAGGREFRPNDKVKRGDMAAFMYRLASQAGRKGGAPSDGDFFADVTGSTYYHDEIWWLAGNGVTQGWGEGAGREYRPTATVKRGDMAAFLHRLDAVQ